ncbi:tRNA1(Val) (adenine(37)-N6)-methyltransferase [Aquimarina muelleri]|uniref:tRNA1(Val) (adenine(37)-N6)-methyltransferase n=1 Tax=Aquimarina muelleri TaxID=279356 RepID=A0A918JWH9_9FLAO|nr:methyltransferase [Aquimarina muelleri]MCX2763952.1 methyltransferase [Aquimarina muelleri]GGX22319.1 tRNA1(Val) (adenine(37)-N6)-methyltransferase [Aquimarina muelleri]
MIKPFQFKEFTVQQDRCAMKIGTDGVLLGAWAPIKESVTSVLDIGTGTGVIALMAAQRCQAEIIDALEIDADAYEQAVENFEESFWGDRLFCYHASFQEFVEEIEETYDLLISNPPFYVEEYKSSNLKRDIARFEDALPFEHLLIGGAKLLSDQGQFALILPYKEEEEILTIARQVGLFPQKITRVKGTPSSAIKRSLLLLGKEQQDFESDELIIESSRHEYTEAYINLTKDFYLKM